MEDCLRGLLVGTFSFKELNCNGLASVVTGIVWDESWVILIGDTLDVSGTDFMLSTTYNLSLDEKEE